MVKTTEIHYNHVIITNNEKYKKFTILELSIYKYLFLCRKCFPKSNAFDTKITLSHYMYPHVQTKIAYSSHTQISIEDAVIIFGKYHLTTVSTTRENRNLIVNISIYS